MNRALSWEDARKVFFFWIIKAGSKVKHMILECGGLPSLWFGKLASRKTPAASRRNESGSKLPRSKKFSLDLFGNIHYLKKLFSSTL
jgi:hypothetical protein